MELALNLGRSVAEVLALSDDELDGWAAYRRKHSLPLQRQEMYLAKLVQVQVGGKLSDHLLRPQEDVEMEETSVSATAANISEIGGGQVHYLKIPAAAMAKLDQRSASGQ